MHGEGQAFLAEQPQDRIVVDLTEPVEVVAFSLLRAAGLPIGVDNTGASFASLRHVLRLSADIIKLDRSLSRD